MRQREVKLVLIVADIVNFIDQWGAVIHYVRRGMTDARAECTSILYVVYSSHCDVIGAI